MIAPPARSRSPFEFEKAVLALAVLALPLALAAACDHSSAAPDHPTSPTYNAQPASTKPAPGRSRKADNDDDDDDDDDGRPYADMYRSLGTVTSVPIRGRLVKEKGQPDLRASTPADEMSQHELERADFEVFALAKDKGAGAGPVKLGASRCDNEGYIDVALPVSAGSIEPGLHTLEIRVKGAPAGRTSARLLSADHAGLVVRSDIDLTYLDTHFARKRDMLALLKQSAAQRKTLPAMEKVYGALRAGATGREDRPLVFISGSPRFFKRTLEARMALDGVEQDGVFLKAFDEIAMSKLLLLDVGAIAPALKEQVAYKFARLLNGRLDLPKKAPEVLLGDDSEADFVVYSLYHRAMTGELDEAGLQKELGRAGVAEDARASLAALAVKVRASLDGLRPVKLIYINLTGFPNDILKVSAWPAPAVMRYHRGAWPLILDLYEEGLVAKEAVTAVRARLIELGVAQNVLDEAAKEGVKGGLLKSESLTLQ
jgi:hypothetical protein